ncbi:MAG: nucleotidyl transferase AbiEii/AbiGii toxin family protein [Nitrobacter sp.]|uniref:nucleotidyl transferase AbiEii/AbiGii toxin family protein n=1 Tax=Nitrobacter sp. TaxID=29420 RepID=UPI002625FE7B|nr:nucleotidyl transferase AbiEii/AbiGii toxin family protein [Nitrobacter sp.]MCV0387925.1 nucleotidyl transferase AbiEii/AbiGii toxin family protein [Nitrobacter sp.]
MIPRDYITEWRTQAPWVQDIQVEQDLVICRALVEIFSHPLLSESLAFRGGTALYKLYFNPAARYSEDIDLVQMRAEPAGAVMEALRTVLDPWLGAPRWKQTEGRVTFVYRFGSEDTPPIPMRLKVEINSREHFAVHGFTTVPFAVASRWFDGRCDIPTYALEELLGTKLRALYQRRKGRDLFDLDIALRQDGLDLQRVIDTFSAYMEHGGHRVTRAQFERNLALKMEDRQFTADIGPLLATGEDNWDMGAAADAVAQNLLARLPGAPWDRGAG